MLGAISDLLWSRVLIVVLIILGLLFTVRSGFVQFRYFGSMFRVMREAFKHQSGHLSSFQALTLSVAGRVGAGNIAGVAVAISLGGPGAVFWMWIIALIGMATSYFECTLAQLYKRREPDGAYRGGPAFYIERGLGKKWLALLFSFLLLMTFGLAFNALQAYQVAASLNDAFGVPALASGIVLAVVLGLIILGGIKRIAAVTEYVVPFMALGYLLIALVVIALNITEMPGILLLIVKSAFGLEPAFAGGLGAALMMGIKRGLYSNEAGLGSAPNVAAVAHVAHPATQGIVQSFSVFIDTVLLCTCTAAIILLSDVYAPGSEAGGVQLTQAALASHVGEWGRSLVSIALLLFAFTTIVYNYYLGENSLSFFSENNKTLFNIYRVVTMGLILWGSLQDLGTAFAFADVFMGLLALVNLAAVFMLFKVGLRVMRDYDERYRAGERPPRFDAARFSDLNLDQTVWSERGAEPSEAEAKSGI